LGRKWREEKFGDEYLAENGGERDLARRIGESTIHPADHTKITTMTTDDDDGNTK